MADLSTDTTPGDEILTVTDLAALLKCKTSSIYNMTWRRVCAMTIRFPSCVCHAG
jgi:hypothetical protein